MKLGKWPGLLKPAMGAVLGAKSESLCMFQNGTHPVQYSLRN